MKTYRENLELLVSHTLVGNPNWDTFENDRISAANIMAKDVVAAVYDYFDMNKHMEALEALLSKSKSKET